jgi:hypothetical protein
MSFIHRNCREVTRLLLERGHRRLTPVERIAVRLHLAICLMCTRFGRQLSLMDRAVAQWKAYREEDAPGDADGRPGG